MMPIRLGHPPLSLGRAARASALLVLAAASGSSPTARALVGQAAVIEQSEADLHRDATANVDRKRELAKEFVRIEPDLVGLSNTQRDLQAYCSGTYDSPEYAVRKARCDAELPALNSRIAVMRQRLGELAALERQRAAEAAKLLSTGKTLGDDRAALLVAAARLPGVGDPVGCGGSPGWSRCVRERICSAVRTRVERTRVAIEQSRRDIAQSQAERQFWAKMNGEAQKGALLAGAKFLLGQYAANTAASSAKLEKLAREADRLAKKAGQSSKGAVRTMYKRQLYETVVKMNAPSRDLMLQVGTSSALTVEEQWSVIRNTLRTEFNLARDRDAEIVKLIRSSQFREAFEPDGIESPESDLLASLAEDAGKSLGELALGVEQYAASVAPAVRAFDFVRDSTYNALLSALSTQRVLQQSDLAGELARASAILQDRYEEDVLDAAACARDVGRPTV